MMSQTESKISKTTSGKKKKVIKRRRTKVERLEMKEAKLRRDLKKTLNEISVDTKEHRTGGEPQTRQERQRLANRSIIIRSQLRRLQEEIDTRNFVTEDKVSKKMQTKIKNRYDNAARKHHRVLQMTVELEKLKQDLEDIRFIANDELGVERRENGEVGFERTENGEYSERSERGFSKSRADATRIERTSFRHSTQELDENARAREERLNEVRESLEILEVETPREKLAMAEGLATKYDMSRELRNLAHAQMFSRHQRNSYMNIIPPYRRKRKKVEHVRRSYVRNFYEDRVDMAKAKDQEKSPRAEVVKKDKEITRYTMTCGRTISLKKVEDLTPPGMDLVAEITPVDC